MSVFEETKRGHEGESPGNEVSKWLNDIGLKDPKFVSKMFFDYGIESLDLLRELTSDEHEEMIKDIKIFGDRAKLRKALKKLNDTKIIISVKENEYLDKLKQEIKLIQNNIKNIEANKASLVYYIYS